MSKSEITIDELILELRRIESSSDGVTSKELASKTGLSVVTVQRKLRQLYDKGLVKVSFKRSYDMTGKGILVPVYKLIKRNARGLLEQPRPEKNSATKKKLSQVLTR